MYMQGTTGTIPPEVDSTPERRLIRLLQASIRSANADIRRLIRLRQSWLRGGVLLIPIPRTLWPIVVCNMGIRRISTAR